jgi:ribulose kinase
VILQESESVLLGAAILGAVGSQRFKTIVDAMQSMNRFGEVVDPTNDEVQRTFHAAKYIVFEDLYSRQVGYWALMRKVFSNPQ